MSMTRDMATLTTTAAGEFVGRLLKMFCCTPPATDEKAPMARTPTRESTSIAHARETIVTRTKSASLSFRICWEGEGGSEVVGDGR